MNVIQRDVYISYKNILLLNKVTLTPWKESYDQLRQHIKKQRHYFAV